MQGRSLWPLLRGDGRQGEAHREAVYCEYLNAMPWHSDPTPYATMVRTRTHKLVAFHGAGWGELYELDSEGGEAVNLWSDPGYRGLRSELLALMLDRVALTADPLPPREAEW
jgi:hypothetical protein